MKHKKIFEKVRELIDERELDEENIDLAYGELLDLIEEDESCAWAYGLLSEIYYWIGETSEGADKLVNFEEGVDWGKKGLAVDEDCLEANFWLAVNYGLYGQEKGIMQSLSLINPIKDLAEKCIELDESYFYGGPWRILGRLYDKAPGFPFSIGNVDKAVECLENAVRLGPKFYLNHLYLADAYLSNRNKAKAKEHLEWIVNAPLNKNHEMEDEDIKSESRRILERL
ncbi:MAG: hypothetical protein KIS76_13025 [Pyrinomonadaceae bacterium]|nr:hypothetical protein [Pyrinomonadaceae bacterium]